MAIAGLAFYWQRQQAKLAATAAAEEAAREVSEKHEAAMAAFSERLAKAERDSSIALDFLIRRAKVETVQNRWGTLQDDDEQNG